jgi:hypothetical protein
MHALQQRDMQRGVAALCIGGGGAAAVAIEASQQQTTHSNTINAGLSATRPLEAAIWH